MRQISRAYLQGGAILERLFTKSHTTGRAGPGSTTCLKHFDHGPWSWQSTL